MAGRRWSEAEPEGSHGAGGNLALTINTDHSVGAGHGAVKHVRGEYAFYDYTTGTNHHVNSVEGFWRLFKASIRSTHVAISPKYMQRYLDEFTFRANHRDRVNGMFDLLVGAL